MKGILDLLGGHGTFINKVNCVHLLIGIHHSMCVVVLKV